MGPLNGSGLVYRRSSVDMERWRSFLRCSNQQFLWLVFNRVSFLSGIRALLPVQAAHPAALLTELLGCCHSLLWSLRCWQLVDSPTANGSASRRGCVRKAVDDDGYPGCLRADVAACYASYGTPGLA